MGTVELDVDEARRDEQPGGVDDRHRVGHGERTGDLGDAPGADEHVGRLRPLAIDDRPAEEHEISRHFALTPFRSGHRLVGTVSSLHRNRPGWWRLQRSWLVSTRGGL